MFGNKKKIIWQYTYLIKRDLISQQESNENVKDILNDLGSRGWELVSTIKNNTNDWIVFWFKRIKDD